MSIPQLFVVTLVLLGIVIALLVVFWIRDMSRSAAADREKKTMEAQVQHLLSQQTNAAVQATLTVARNRQEELLQVVRRSTNVLQELLVAVGQLEGELSALKTNEAGKTFSPHPDLVAQMRRLYEDEARDVPGSSEIVRRLEAARRLEQQTAGALNSGYSPDASQFTSAQEGVFWAESKKRAADQFGGLLVSLEREAKAKVVLKQPTEQLTLEDAMRQLSLVEEKARNALITQQTDAARIEAAKREAEGAAGKIISQGEALKAEQLGQAKIIEATGQAKKTDAELEADRVLAAAQKKRLQEKASRADLKNQLAAYLTPGYFLPPARGAMGFQRAYDKKPMSYSTLRERGALEPTMDALHTFVAIGVHRGNDRPRLNEKYLSQIWDRNTELLEQAKSLQQLMIELGPTWAEMGVMEK
jgi:hypothetical protein